MQAETPEWPQKQDYDAAIQKMPRTIHDPEIRDGVLVKDGAGIKLFGGANNYVTLYRVDDWIVRCFCRDDLNKSQPPSDIKQRYQAISAFCKIHASDTSPLVEVIYVPDAIEVDFMNRQGHRLELIKSEKLPWVRSKFLSESSLGTFIAGNHFKPLKMKQLCAAWLRMIRNLEEIHMAHGDLDLTNIFVKEEQNGNMILKLIDYDNSWIPDFDHQQLEKAEMGHEHFQHPAFQDKSAWVHDEYMDRFPALTIYISLKALATHSDLYTKKEWIKGDSHLLLMKTDYDLAINFSYNRIDRLRDLNIPELRPLLDELSSCLQERRQPRSLTELLLSPPTRPINILPTPSAEDKPVPGIKYFDFAKATFYKDPNKPLITRSPEPSIKPQPPQPGQAHPQHVESEPDLARYTGPAPRWTQPPQHVEPETNRAQLPHQPDQQARLEASLDTERVPDHVQPVTPSQAKSLPQIISWLIIAILVVLIFIAILVIAHLIHFQGTTPSRILASFTRVSPVRHRLLESYHLIDIKM